MGRMFQITVGPTYEDVRRRFSAYLEEWQDKIDRITDLFLRMKTTSQVELAATVHFAAGKMAKELDRKPTEGEVLEAVLDWKKRRRPPIEPSSIAKTIRQLASLGWLDLQASPDLPVDDEAVSLEV